MGRTKTKAYDKLYVIEKLVKIIEENGEKFVVVKWKNFSDAQSTKEPLSYFAHMQACRDDLQKLEEEFQQRKYLNIVNIEEKANEYYEEYKSSIFSLPNKKQSQENYPNKQKRKEEIEEKVRCKKLAQAHIKKKIMYGLKQLQAEDYFYFMNLLHQCQEILKQMLISKTVPRTNAALDEIKGLVKDNNTYLYYVSIASKVYTCSQPEMKEYFPQKFTKYLFDLTRYMKNYMSDEINAEEAVLKTRAYRQQELYKATNVIKLKEDFQFDKNPVFFGLNEEDALQNKKEENQRKMKIQTLMKEDDIFCIDKTEQQPTESVSAIEDFYADMKAQMNEMGIKMTVKTDKRRNSKGKFQSAKPKENITRKESNSKDKSQKQNNAMEEQEPQNIRKGSIIIGRESRGNSRSRGSSGRGSSSSRGNSKSQASSRGIINSSSKEKSKKSSNQSRFQHSPASRSSDRLREKKQKKSKLKSKHKNDKAAEDPYSYDYSPRRSHIRAGQKNPRPSDPAPSKHQKKE